MEAIKGIDISYCQKGIDLSAAKAAGVSFAIIRAGISVRTDTEFVTNTEKAEKIGLPYGFYWYSRAFSVADAVAEAEACIAAIKPYAPSYPVFYDMEEQDQVDKLDNAARTAIITAFCDKIKASGYTAGVYINPAWMEDYVDKTQLMGKYDIWLAHWTGGADIPSKYDYGQTIWQWGYGKLDGAEGDVDGDICFVDYLSSAACKKSEEEAVQTENKTDFAVGDTVFFSGGSHYVSSTAAEPTGNIRTAGTAKITNIAQGAIHPYHLVGDSSNVYGWVNDELIMHN